MPAYQLNKIFYIKSQKVVKEPNTKINTNRSYTIFQKYELYRTQQHSHWVIYYSYKYKRINSNIGQKEKQSNIIANLLFW